MSHSPSLRSEIVPIRNLQALVDHATAAGFDPSRIFEGTGIEPAILSTAGALISYQRYIAAYRNLCALPLPADWFLRSGTRFDISNYGILGYAMMSSENLGRAIDIAMKYYRTGGPLLALSFTRSDTTASIVLEPLFNLETSVVRAATESLLAAFPPLVRMLLGKPVEPVSVALAYPEHGRAHHYEAVFHCPITFDAPRSSYTVDALELSSPILEADADAARLLEQSCRTLLNQLDHEHSLSARIRHLLLTSPGRPMHAGWVAGQLNISERTLRRHLRREGTSFQQVVDEVRANMAMDYLRSTDLSTQQIAELVGFSEATNFRRAFLRWTNQSPHQFRTHQRRHPAPEW